LDGFDQTQGDDAEKADSPAGGHGGAHSTSGTQIQAEGIAEVTLLGHTDEILATAKKFNVSLDGVFSCDPEKDADFQTYVDAYL
jgi:phosphotransacetylase